MEDSLILTYDASSKDVPTLVVSRKEGRNVRVLNVLRDNQAFGIYHYLTGGATLVHKEEKTNVREHIREKEEYIKYFTRMQEENKQAPLSRIKWNWICAWVGDATERDKLFTRNELADMFPDLLGYMRED